MKPSMDNPPDIKIPQSRFCTSELPEADRYDAWSDSLAPMFRPTLAHGIKPTDISVSTDFFLLGETILGTTAMMGVGGASNPGGSPLRCTPEVFVIEYIWRGGYSGYNGAQPVKATAGDISILEPSRGLSLVTEPDLGVLNFIVPRQLLQEVLGRGGNPHSRVISGQSLTGQILRQAMVSTRDGLPHQSFAEAKVASGLLVGAIAGMVRGEGRGADPAVDHATLDAMCAYIERNLANPELGPDHLCKRFHCSRARLYRLFAPLDGVANYIRRARLERCHAALLSASRKISILDVAMEWGFGSVNHFNRLFREAYGLSPGEVRRAVLEPEAHSTKSRRGPLLHAPEYQAWLQQL